MSSKYDWTGLRFEKDGDRYTLDNVEFHASVNGQSEFMISLANGTMANTQNQTFGSDFALEKVDGTYDTELKRKINANSPTSVVLRIDPGVYNLYLDYKPATNSANDAATLRIEEAKDIETDVAAIEVSAADLPILWYDLTGMAVAEPTRPGIYICRQGDKVWKVYIR